MNLVDLGALLLVVWLGVRGYVKGLLQEALEAASALIGVVAASRTYGELGDLVAVYTGLPVDVTRPVMYAAVAVSVTAVGFFVAAMVRLLSARRAQRARARSLDEYGGLIFGVLKGVFFAALLVLFAAQLPSASVWRTLDASAFGRAVMASAPVIYRLAP